MAESRYDVLVVGAGHAGVEAAAAAARLGVRCLLLTMRLDEVARMSCNPAIGGLAKGHVVCEIDALGGVMARAIDATGLQFRMLNTGKGPAVQAPRAQADKVDYPLWVRQYLETAWPNLTLAEGTAERILTDAAGTVCGVELANGSRIFCRALVLTAGTFLEGLIHIGNDTLEAGRWGNAASIGLAQSLRDLGIKTLRLKTGTPARLDSRSIRWESLPQQNGDDPPPSFSYMTARIDRPQIACALTHTNPRTHAIIADNLERSPLYSGRIVGLGPRYCPSIETKIVRFAERDSHQVFLEPESLHNNLVYPNGISTSLPSDVQEAFLRSIRGLENVAIVRYGYAIEYTACDPTQMLPTLQVRGIPGLYLAGQILGTSGYEEAGGLGLVAGANAALNILGRKPLTLRRDEAYIGVMIDDLITKGAPEPYRLFTSRAEYRLLLRQDNADLRLTPRGRDAGLIDDARWDAFLAFRDGVEKEQQRLRSTLARLSDLDATAMASAGETIPAESIPLERLLVRPGIQYRTLCQWGFGPAPATAGELPTDAGSQHPAEFPEPGNIVTLVDRIRHRIAAQVEICAKYSGYIDRQRKQVERALSLEAEAMPREIDYAAVNGLRREAADILAKRKPSTIGQASRIPGVNPADITSLLIHLRTQHRS